jgi:hypothetical protein
MATEVLSLFTRWNGSSEVNLDTLLSAKQVVNFDKKRNIIIRSITASGWQLSLRDHSEGGARSATPRYWIALEGDCTDQLTGPVHTPLEFTGISGLTLYVEIPQFFLADPTYR